MQVKLVRISIPVLACFTATYAFGHFGTLVSSQVAVADPEYPATQVPGPPVMFETQFLTLNGLESFGLSDEELSLEKLPAFVGMLSTRTGAPVNTRAIGKLLLYCAEVEGVSAEKVYGVSVLRNLGVGLEHHELYRWDPLLEEYAEDPNAALWLDGALPLDHLNLLHFACVPRAIDGSLAKRSAIRILRAPNDGTWVDPWPNAEFGVALGQTLLSNPEYDAGMSLLGAYGTELYEAVLGDSQTLGWCSAHLFCSDYSLKSCRLGWWGWACTGGSTTCSLSAVDREIMDMQAPTFERAPLALSWNFRDAFLENSQAGRDYISRYYKLSSVFELDPADLPLYTEFLPQAATAMTVLLEGGAEETVITQPLANSAIAIIEIQRQRITNPEILKILDQTESDLMLYTGLPRADFLSLFASE